LLGTVDMTESGSAAIGGIFESSFQALDLPFLWASRPQIWKVMDGPIGQELFTKLEAKGFKGLCFGGGWGFRNMMSNKRAVVVVDDMKGQTIRVQESPTYIGMMKAMGANPVPMPFGELYLAMKQGTIDGMELPPSSVVSEKFHEVTKFYSLTQHSYSPIGFFMSLKKYQAMPAELQKVVDDAAKEACAFQRKDEVEKDIAGLEVIRKAGVRVNDVKDVQEFQDRMSPVFQTVEAKVGKVFMDRLMTAVRTAR
jgi:TRAP-type transport system periplasmic protein